MHELGGRFIPIMPVTTGTGFLIRKGVRLMATPLLVALVVIESTDLIFALDSIPAVFAVTRDPFLVYTSNVFALLGLRSLYFVLAGAIRDLRFLRTGLGIMLLLVAAKMLLADIVEIPAVVSLGVVVSFSAQLSSHQSVSRRSHRREGYEPRAHRSEGDRVTFASKCPNCHRYPNSDALTEAWS